MVTVQLLVRFATRYGDLCGVGHDDVVAAVIFEWGKGQWVGEEGVGDA